MNLAQIATATVSAQNIGAGAVESFNASLTADGPQYVIATIQITSRGGGATVDIRITATAGGRLLFAATAVYTATATASLEIQTLPFRWKNAETLVLSVAGSDALDTAVNITTIVEQAESGGGGGLDAAGVRTAIGLAAANLDTQLSGIQSDTDNIQTRLPSALESGRIAAVLDSTALDSVLEAISLIAGRDWTDEEKAQIRYRLGLNGTATAPDDPEAEPIVVTPATGIMTTGWLVTRTKGVATADIIIRYRHALEPNGDTGSSYDSDTYEATSNSEGIAELSLVKGGQYYIWRGAVQKPANVDMVTVPSDAGSTYELPSHVGD